MKNFKEIAEKCLAGKLSGTFELASGKLLSSDRLKRVSDECKTDIYQYQMYVNGRRYYYTIYGTLYGRSHNSLDIINFISNSMQEQIKIDIPEGKVPVMEQTENGITITWANKDITYKQVFDYLNENHQLIQYQANMMVNKNDSDFLRKVNVIGKLTNIRNYFGKPDGTRCGYYIYKSDRCGFQVASTGYPSIYANGVVAFKEKEHAEQAIKMLGDELKYLFEPW